MRSCSWTADQQHELYGLPNVFKTFSMTCFNGIIPKFIVLTLQPSALNTQRQFARSVGRCLRPRVQTASSGPGKTCVIPINVDMQVDGSVYFPKPSSIFQRYRDWCPSLCALFHDVQLHYIYSRSGVNYILSTGMPRVNDQIITEHDIRINPEICTVYEINRAVSWDIDCYHRVYSLWRLADYISFFNY